MGKKLKKNIKFKNNSSNIVLGEFYFCIFAYKFKIMIKNNNKYTEVKKEDSFEIIFEKGCIVDYEILWNRILVDNLISMKAVESIYEENLNGSDSVKFNKKVVVKFETRQRKNKL